MSSMMLMGAGSSASGGGAGFVGALDLYTAGMAGAWSVARRLLTSYMGPLIRVRRSSDDTEQDIGYADDGSLDAAALLSFCGAGSGYVKTIYDQSGLARNSTQGTAAAQRRIVNAGTIETLSGLPVMRCSADSQFYATSEFTAYTGVSISTFARGSITGGVGGFPRIVSVSTGTQTDYTSPGRAALLAYQEANSLLGYRNPNAALVNVAYTAGSQFVASSIFDGVNFTIHNNAASASQTVTDAFNITNVLFGGYASNGAECYTGDTLAEAVIYFADKTVDEAAIRAALTP